MNIDCNELAEIICKAQHIDPDANVMYGIKSMKAREARLPIAKTIIEYLKEINNE